MSSIAPADAFRSRVLPLWTLLGAMISVQFGATWAKKLFPIIGPVHAVALRVGISAVLLLIVVRPWRNLRLNRKTLPLLLAYGLILAGMNLTFYEALQRIPLGIAVALEFTGPLTLAVVLSHRRLDLLWVGLAVIGLVLLLPLEHTSQVLDPLGVAFALLAAVGWALYSLVGRKAGRELGESPVVAAGMTVAALAMLPVSLAVPAPAHVPVTMNIVIAAVLMSVLSSALPFQLEMISIARLPTRVYSTLTSLEPAIGTLSGLLILREVPTAMQVAGMAAIMAASAGAALCMETRPAAGEP